MAHGFGWPELGASLVVLKLLPPPFNVLGTLALLAPALMSL